MVKRATFFFPTRNRVHSLEQTLNSIDRFCSPYSNVLVGNCSSGKDLQETSDLIKKYNFAKEVVYNPDPGMGVVFTELFNKIETEFGICFGDDNLMLKDVAHLFKHFDDDSRISLVALPMVDNTAMAPSQEDWPTDQFGCVLWMTPTGRCANHVMVRVSSFEKSANLYGPDWHVDNYFHNNTTCSQRIWPDDGAYIYHTRYDDDTRINSVIAGDVFRFPVGHPGRCGSLIDKAKDRK